MCWMKSLSVGTIQLQLALAILTTVHFLVNGLGVHHNRLYLCFPCGNEGGSRVSCAQGDREKVAIKQLFLCKLT